MNQGSQGIPINPHGNENLNPEDFAKCPFSQIKTKTPAIPQKDKKEKKPKGGCPLFVSDVKKNPSFGPLREYFKFIFR